MSKKTKYTIEVCRTGFGFKNIEVEANSFEEAIELALDDAGNHEFSESEAEYTTDSLPTKPITMEAERALYEQLKEKFEPFK